MIDQDNVWAAGARWRSMQGEESGMEAEVERMEKRTIEKEDGRLLTYYRFVPIAAAEDETCPN